MASVPDLLTLLRRREPIAASALCRELGISRATLSRVVGTAGDEVVRLGYARATRYARTRLVEGVGRSAPLHRVGPDGVPRAAGRLVFLWAGATWLEAEGDGRLFTGLPPALVDMAPQGYLGHGFAARFPELALPPRVSDWSDDHRLRALALRGEDTVGDLILGRESLDRFLRWSPVDTGPSTFPALAERAALDVAGSSAGGERPKFGARTGGRHVLVKFAPPGDAPAIRRWRDLLWCEWRALQLLCEAGVTAATAALRDVDGWRFLEAERFDRIGERGRRAVLSLGALRSEYLEGEVDTWTDAAAQLRAAPFSLSAGDASRLRWLDAFGQLAGNDDRHLWNVAFFVAEDGTLTLAPAYDMLPMVLAPAGDLLAPRAFAPAPPRADALAEWLDAAPWAVRYWRELEDASVLHPGLRDRAGEAAAAVEVLARRLGARGP